MLVFLRRDDGSLSEHYYYKSSGFVTEIILTNKDTWEEMRGSMFFEEDYIEFVTNEYDFQTFEVVSIVPEGY